MTLELIRTKLKEAMIARDEFATLVLRSLVSAIHNKEIEKRGVELTEADSLDILKKELKKRNEAAELFVSGGRQELADKEKKEAEYIKQFLPPEISKEELEKIIEEIMSKFENPIAKDMGLIIKEVMAKAGGGADSGTVAGIVKKKLL